ncbi:MAG: hypothetical protein ACJ78Q_16900 [Chloroflexia bacterium]
MSVSAIGVWPGVVVRALRERALWVALGFGLVALVLGYQSPRSLYVDIGGQFDGPHTPGFYAPEQSGQASFRWASSGTSLLFQGLGRPLEPVVVALQLSSGRGAGSAPIEVLIAANGHAAPALQVGSESATYAVSIDPAWVDAGGDLRLDFSSPVFSRAGDRRELGFVADFARVELPGGPVIPAVPQIAWLLVAGLLLYVLMRGAGVVPTAAGWVVAVFLAGCAMVIAVQRLLLTVFTGRLVATLIIALLVALVAEPLVRGLAGWAGWKGEGSLPEWAWTGLRALVLATAVLKIGGLLYPHTFIIDSSFHLRLITYMAEGRSWDEYFGKSLALSVMPKEEWGAAKAFIPYSPFFYVVAAPLYWLPVPLAMSVPVFSAILETLKVGWVFLLGLALGGARHAGRRALASAAIYAAIPATFLLQQWGNWPTQTSLYMLTLWAAVTCLFWRRYMERWVWAVSTLLLLLTLLSYTVTAAYTGVFIGLLVATGWLVQRGERRRWGALGLSLVAATALSLVIYYGQWIPTIIEETLPTFGKAVEEQGKLTTLRPTLATFLTDNIGRAMQSYSLAMVYALGVAGALWLLFGVTRGRRNDEHGSRQSVFALVATRQFKIEDTGLKIATSAPVLWLGVWLLTFPLFTLLDFWVDQALKEFWFALPAIAVASAVWVLSLWERARGPGYRALAWVLWAILVWQSLSLWVFRLLFHNR